ncbi:TPA: hypothetical protein TVG95_001317 [Streptococcus equi subsp. zooepidemicus]|nr:hypothetical protein [Streptococcus equi subsp. zooepidemicus]
MKIVKSIFIAYWKLSVFMFRLLRPFMNYIEKELHKTIREMGPSGTVPVDNNLLNAAAAEKEEARRKMIEAERQAQIAAERARQTQHHQDQLRAAQARADADRARRQY